MHFLKYKKLFRSVFFLNFFELGKFCFLKYKFFRVSISWNIGKFCFRKYKEFFQGLLFLKYKKSFLWENVRNILIFEPESSISRNIKKYKNDSVLNMSWGLNMSWVLNILFPKYKKNFFKENIRKFRFLKLEKLFFWENIRNFFRGGFFNKFF